MYQTNDLVSAAPAIYYRLARQFTPHVHPGSGLMTFDEFSASNHNALVAVGSILTNGLSGGLTATVGGTSGGFGISTNLPSPGPLTKPTLFVYGDGAGSSFNFNAPVIVPSLWTASPSWALNNDPSHEQRITGKLNGSVVWTFSNTNNSTVFFEVTTGAGQTINELVFYPKWIGVDNIAFQETPHVSLGAPSSRRQGATNRQRAGETPALPSFRGENLPKPVSRLEPLNRRAAGAPSTASASSHLFSRRAETVLGAQVHGEGGATIRCGFRRGSRFGEWSPASRGIDWKACRRWHQPGSGTTR